MPHREKDERYLRPLLYLSRRLKKQYEKECAAAAERFGLSQSESDVLLFLANNPDFDTAMDVVRYRFVSKALVSKAVDALCARSYLRLQTDAEDRRYTHLILTDQALPAVTALRGAQESFLAFLKGMTTPEERGVIQDVFDRFLHYFEEM